MEPRLIETYVVVALIAFIVVSGLVALRRRIKKGRDARWPQKEARKKNGPIRRRGREAEDLDKPS